MESPESQMLMPILAHTRQSSIMKNTTDNVQYATPHLSVCDVGAIMGSTRSTSSSTSTTITAGPSPHEHASATTRASPAAVDSTVRSDSHTRRTLEDLFDKVLDTTEPRAKEEMNPIIQEDIPSTSTTTAGPSDHAFATVDSWQYSYNGRLDDSERFSDMQFPQGRHYSTRR